MSTYRELAIVFQAYNEAIAQAKSDARPDKPTQIRLELEDDDVPLVVQALRTAALDPAGLLKSYAADYPQHAALIRDLAERLRNRLAVAEGN